MHYIINSKRGSHEGITLADQEGQKHILLIKGDQR